MQFKHPYYWNRQDIVIRNTVYDGEGEQSRAQSLCRAHVVREMAGIRTLEHTRQTDRHPCKGEKDVGNETSLDESSRGGVYAEDAVVLY